MKIIIIIVIILVSISYTTAFVSKNTSVDRGNSAKIVNDDELNGKTFTGKATEITPPDVDRMPIVYDETISFQNGKLVCETFKKYIDSNTDSYYTSSIDGRRMIAYKVVIFNSVNTGYINGQSVTLDFSGNVIGDSRLNGTLIIRYPDNSEVKFLIEGLIN